MNKTFNNIESKEIQFYDGNSQEFIVANTFMKTSRLFLFFIMLILSINTNSQVSRRDTKKSVPYRANYQRMATSSGAYHSFEIRNGELWGWGCNTDGQLGDDSYIDKNHPVRIGTAKNWVSVASGDKFSVGLRADGSLWAWGFLTYGSSVLDGAKGGSNYFLMNQTTPSRIDFSNDWVSIGAGDNYALGLKADGTLWAWGYLYPYVALINYLSMEPTKVNEDHDWASISMGRHHALALKTDGTLWAWGRGDTGQLGDGIGGSTAPSELLSLPLKPVKVNLDKDWTAIAAGGNHSLALKSDGTLWAWGFNKDGQLGNPDSGSIDVLPRQVGEDANWTSIAAGFSHSLGLKSDGTLWAWGSNDMGQIGNGGIIVDGRLPTQIGFRNNWVSIAAGYSHSMGLQADGSLYTWGYNNYGQLGNHDIALEMAGDPSFVNLNINKPVQIREPLTAWISFSVSENHTIGLKADGTIWEYYSPLGTFQRVGASYDWVSAEAGVSHSIGLKADGTIWTWGSNTFGQLGLGDKTDRSIPTMIESDRDFVSISAGSSFSIGLKSDGTLWSWGYNDFGQLGSKNTFAFTVPVSMWSNAPYPTSGTHIANTWVGVSAGASHVLALKADGTLWACGRNSFGQVGDYGYDASWWLKKVEYMNVVGLAAGGSHSVDLSGNGELRASGWDIYGQCGNGPFITDYWDGFTQEKSKSKNWINVAAGLNSTFGIQADGSLWAWGNNTQWQLGDGGALSSKQNRYEPVKIIGDFKEWVSVKSASSFSIGINCNGESFIWGNGVEVPTPIYKL